MRVNKVSLHVGKIMTGYGSDDYVEIEISDAENGCRLLDVKLSLEEASKAFLFSGHVEVDAKFYNLDRIGQIRQHKQVLFPDDREHHKCWDHYVREQLADDIADGWIVGENLTWNHHNASNGVYRMSLLRFVNDDEN